MESTVAPATADEGGGCHARVFNLDLLTAITLSTRLEEGHITSLLNRPQKQPHINKARSHSLDGRKATQQPKADVSPTVACSRTASGPSALPLQKSRKTKPASQTPALTHEVQTFPHKAFLRPFSSTRLLHCNHGYEIHRTAVRLDT